MDPKKKGKMSIISGVGSAGLAAMLLLLASVLKSDYTYNFDRDVQKGVSFLYIMAVIMVILALVEIMTGVAAMQSDSGEQNVSDQKSSNLMNCPDCGNMVSKHAKCCPHCGREMQTAEDESNNPPDPKTTYGQDKVPAWMQVEMEKEDQK